jgi:hypothetical protein
MPRCLADPDIDFFYTPHLNFSLDWLRPAISQSVHQNNDRRYARTNEQPAAIHRG